MKKLSKKQIKKKCDKKCYFCDCDTYELLDVHRIIEGKDGGKYTDWNTVVCCATCHRKAHAGIIKIFRKHYSTKGYVIHYIDEHGIEHWK